MAYRAAAVAFEAGAWAAKLAAVVASWRRAWDRVISFFAFPPEVRRVIYTSNAIESVHARLRKIIKTRGHFPSDEAATKLIWPSHTEVQTAPGHFRGDEAIHGASRTRRIAWARRDT